MDVLITVRCDRTTSCVAASICSAVMKSFRRARSTAASAVLGRRAALYVDAAEGQVSDSRNSSQRLCLAMKEPQKKNRPVFRMGFSRHSYGISVEGLYVAFLKAVTCCHVP
jgi:hypothetical protein